MKDDRYRSEAEREDVAVGYKAPTLADRRRQPGDAASTATSSRAGVDRASTREATSTWDWLQQWMDLMTSRAQTWRSRPYGQARWEKSLHKAGEGWTPGPYLHCRRWGHQAEVAGSAVRRRDRAGG